MITLLFILHAVTHLRSKKKHKTVEVRQLKNFYEAEFLRENVDFWKHLLASVIDKHAPFRTKRVYVFHATVHQ